MSLVGAGGSADNRSIKSTPFSSRIDLICCKYAQRSLLALAACILLQEGNLTIPNPMFDYSQVRVRFLEILDLPESVTTENLSQGHLHWVLEISGSKA